MTPMMTSQNPALNTMYVILFKIPSEGVPLSCVFLRELVMLPFDAKN